MGNGGPANQLPIPGLPPTLQEDLSTKSSTGKQAARYVDSALNHLPGFLQRWQGYNQAYMLFQKDVDNLLADVINTLDVTFPSSMVIRTSERGEMGGAHGGVRDTWYNAYEESTHVPLIISGPMVEAQRGTRDDISSSVDILTTMLAMASADVTAIQKDVFNGHRHDVLPGRDLLKTTAEKDQIVFFETYDHLTRHNQATVPLAQHLPSSIKKAWLLRTLLASEELDSLTNIEAVVAKPGGDTRAGYPGRGGKVWKLIRHFDDPGKWSQPGILNEPRLGQQHGRFYRNRKLTKERDEELELYDLDRDPYEEDNLAHNHEYRAVLVSMQSILNASRPPTSAALPKNKPLDTDESWQSCGIVVDTVVAGLYVLKRIEREFPSVSLKFALGLLLFIRLLGPYYIVRRFLGLFASPLNIVAGLLHMFIGTILMYDHNLAFFPNLPLLPDALAHESRPTYLVLGMFSLHCGIIQFSLAAFGGLWKESCGDVRIGVITTRASKLNRFVLCSIWIAEWVVYITLLWITPSFDILDFPLAFVIPLMAAIATWCAGDVSKTWLSIRLLAATSALVGLVYFVVAQVLIQQGLITNIGQVPQMDIVTLKEALQLRDLHVADLAEQSVRYGREFIDYATTRIRHIVTKTSSNYTG